MLVENKKVVAKGKQKTVSTKTQSKRQAACKKQLIFLRGPPKEPTPAEEEFCLICNEPYSNPRSKDIWIQCNACELWAHKECTTYNDRIFYVRSLPKILIDFFPLILSIFYFSLIKMVNFLAIDFKFIYRTFASLSAYFCPMAWGKIPIGQYFYNPPKPATKLIFLCKHGLISL